MDEICFLMVVCLRRKVGVGGWMSRGGFSPTISIVIHRRLSFLGRQAIYGASSVKSDQICVKNGSTNGLAQN